MVWPFKKKTAAPPKPTPQPKKRLDLDALMAKGVNRPEQRAAIEAAMSAVCHEDFPDNEENVWTLRKYLDLQKMIFVLMEPEPKDVGYDFFIFCMRVLPGQPPNSIAIYAYNQGDDFSLLATAPGCPVDTPRSIKWEV